MLKQEDNDVNSLKKKALTICIGDIVSTSESGHNDNAHDHEKPIHHRYVNLTHYFLGGMDYFDPRKATKSHCLLYAREGCRNHSLARNHSSKCSYHKYWPEQNFCFANKRMT
jgi:hypothetical protein